MKLLKALLKGIHILWSRLTRQGLRVTALWAADHAVRIVTGAPIRSVSQITPHLHVGGQYRRRGWPILVSRGITAVVNMRIEFDDNDAGLAPERYLYLPTVNDEAPTLEPEKPDFEPPSLARAEWEHINRVLSDCGGNISEAARQLGIHRRSLQRKLRKHAPRI